MKMNNNIIFGEIHVYGTVCGHNIFVLKVSEFDGACNVGSIVQCVCDDTIDRETLTAQPAEIVRNLVVVIRFINRWRYLPPREWCVYGVQLICLFWMKADFVNTAHNWNDFYTYVMKILCLRPADIIHLAKLEKIKKRLKWHFCESIII